MRTRIVVGIAAFAATSAVAVAMAPTATAEPHPDGKNYPTVLEFRLDHDQVILAHSSGLPAALSAANIAVPAGVWTRFVDINADAINADIAESAKHPRGCFEYVLSVAREGNDWYARTTVIPTCPW